ncbi:DMT family transporter [Undibacterium sp. Xuan67W]|uniref:DMT family transporter n=1 Tax=Undibacterium sp. Xuan67W TaxID=3413057 RepID=UPI003BF020E2
MNKLQVEAILNQTYYAWTLLAISVLAEVTGTVALRYSAGFTKLVPSVISGICYLMAVWLMAVVIKHIEVGLTYAVWAAGGIAVTAAIGIIGFGESSSPQKMAGLALIIAGVVLLNTSKH